MARKPYFSIQPPKGSDGWKTRGHWLAEALGAKYSHSRGYFFMSERRKLLWEAMMAAQWHCTRKFLARDKTPYRFGPEGAPAALTAAQAEKTLLPARSAVV